MVDLPESVDCLIVGTGLINSILAAACSRVGKSVLHIDNKSYYGDEWASFTYQQLLEWIDINKTPINSSEPTEKKESGSINLHRPLRERLFFNLEMVDNFQERDKQQTTSAEIDEDVTDLLKKSRLFCFDLAPHLIYSISPIVELLVKSNVARYHEFKNCIKILSVIDGHLHSVPFTRSDLFSSTIGLIDRRRLMQFLESCFALDETTVESADDPIIANARLPIDEYLIKRELNETLRNYLINSIAMVDSQTSTLDACKSVKRFLLAFERYGKSPFLFPMYGCGEFPQSFCRLSAVFGGTYCLNKQVDNLQVIKSTDEANTIHFLATLDGKKIKCNKVVMKRSDAVALTMIDPDSNEINLSRCIIVTKRSLMPSEQESLYFLRIPPQVYGNEKPILVLEFNSSVMVAPPNLFIIYMWTESTSATAKLDLQPVVECLLSTGESVMFSCYYNQRSSQDSTFTKVFDEIYLTSPPSSSIDYDNVVKESETIFKAMYGNEEFLPRAPDPDEIVFPGDDQEAVSDSLSCEHD